MGYTTSKERKESLIKISLFPLLFGCWTLYRYGSLDLFHCFLPLISGGLLGYFVLSEKILGVDQNTKQLHFVGSYTTFIVLLYIFAVKFCFGFLHDTYPELALEYSSLEAAFCCSFSGIFLGRVTHYNQVFFSRPTLPAETT